MLEVRKEASLTQREIPFGLLEVWYPDRAVWREQAFRDMAEAELAALRPRFGGDYDRKAVFGENPYCRFFKKFKKTCPVLLQTESVFLKGRPFPDVNPVTEVPFLAELTTGVLMGTHDIERIQGPLVLFSGTEKTPFPGLRGEEVHTYPNDVCGRDDGGIIFSMIAGADARTCARPESRHVFYPVFGTPSQPPETLVPLLDRLERYVAVLAPTARTARQLL